MYNGKWALLCKPIAGYLNRTLLIWLLLVAGLSACTNPKSNPNSTLLDLSSVFPAANAFPGWVISQKVETYTHDNLFNLVDGQADSFFVYGFEQAAVQRYQNSDGVRLNMEIWQLATPADAFGLFTAGQAGTSADIGNDGDFDPGRRLAFWQDRYFVSLSVDQAVPDETLQAFGKAIVGKLPTGGERPVIVNRLPQGGLVQRGYIFFHEEMSIQMEVWLGGENLLGLSQDTSGVVGRYKFGDGTARLMLIEYPAAGQAARGREALHRGGISDLIVSDLRGNLLGAVFGKIDIAQAQTLLQEALK